jgi:hypothetical protein
MITQNIAHEKWDYDDDTGVFTHKNGKTAGNKNLHGYVRIGFDGKTHSAHRLAWLYVYGEFPKGHLDHINGIRHDNRISNLREVSMSGNSMNQRKAHSHNSTGFLGVSRMRNKFSAVICINGVQKYLGIFDTPSEAHSVYLFHKRKLHETCTI